MLIASNSLCFLCSISEEVVHFCRQFVHPHKAGLHAAAYAKAENLSTDDHHHDSATAVLRAGLRTIVDRCAASSSARTAVLNTLSQLDRLSPGSKLEARQSSGASGMVPRMRGDIHPNLTAAVMNIDTTMHNSLAPTTTASADVLAPCTPGGASSMMSDACQPTLSSQKDRKGSQWQGMSRDPTRTQSQPDMAAYLLQSRRSNRRESPMKSSPLASAPADGACQSPIARQSPLNAPPVGPAPGLSNAASSQHSSPYTSQRVPTAAEGPGSRPHLSPSSSTLGTAVPVSPGLAHRRMSGDAVAAGAVPSGSPVSRPAAVNAGWLCTTITAFNTSQAASVDGASTPARSPSRTSMHAVPLPPTRLRAALENAQGTEGMPAALSLPHGLASGSASGFQAMRMQESDAGCVGRCISVGDFEFAGARSVDEEGAKWLEDAATFPGWEHIDVSRRWRLMQRHVKVLGLESKLRRDMWKDVLDAAISQSASSSEHGAGSPQQDVAQEDLDRNLSFEPHDAGHTVSGSDKKRSTSLDAEETHDSLRHHNTFTPHCGSTAAAASSLPSTPRRHKKWFGRF